MIPFQSRSLFQECPSKSQITPLGHDWNGDILTVCLKIQFTTVLKQYAAGLQAELLY